MRTRWWVTSAAKALESLTGIAHPPQTPKPCEGLVPGVETVLGVGP